LRPEELCETAGALVRLVARAVCRAAATLPGVAAAHMTTTDTTTVPERQNVAAAPANAAPE
jgi:hypothetical protein